MGEIDNRGGEVRAALSVHHSTRPISHISIVIT